ncbi:hypothetical protein OG552_01280 [Streptomyces sp. NBC_01476]|uniref:hypothetical protein n=1 Tax=Streptomyces sp. NBC_01476 TaxID=2903881 RepID=UPI002E32C4E3|nr:hypothetical protein [Streptomyces sp. NBC_01476]
MREHPLKNRPGLVPPSRPGLLAVRAGDRDRNHRGAATVPLAPLAPLAPPMSRRRCRTADVVPPMSYRRCRTAVVVPPA